MTGLVLVNFVVFQAARNSSIRKGFPPAYVAPVRIAKDVSIFDVHNYGVLGVLVAIRDAAWHDGSNGFISLHQESFTFGPAGWFLKPFVRLGKSIIAMEDVARSSDVHGWSFPVVHIEDMGSQPSGCDYLRRFDVVGENIRPLISLEKFSSRFPRLIREAYQATSQGNINGEQPSRDFRPKKYFLAVGCILILGGFVLISKILDKVYLCTGFNVNMAVGGFFLALFLVWIGFGIIFWALGIMF